MTGAPRLSVLSVTRDGPFQISYELSDGRGSACRVFPVMGDLIEAAPDLLKALQIILTHADDPEDDGEHWEEDRARAIAAIQKAGIPC